MSKPDWNKAPQWANFAAQDPDGQWYWYEFEPSVNCGEWCEDSDAGRITRAYATAESWHLTLEQRP